MREKDASEERKLKKEPYGNLEPNIEKDDLWTSLLNQMSRIKRLKNISIRSKIRN